MKVLISGGSGFLGKRLSLIKPDWIYFSSRECNLFDYNQTYKFIREINPDAIIHLAARVGGILANIASPANFLYENNIINNNIVHASYKAGVRRLLACSSTCAFPDIVKKYPFTEDDLFLGAPTESNLAYGESKRVLYLLTRSYSQQYGVSYSSFFSTNLYGKGDNFDNFSSHFIPSLIRKIYEAKSGDIINLQGDGTPLKQELYVDNLAEIIPLLLDKHLTTDPLIVANSEVKSVKEISELCIKIARKDLFIRFNGKNNGQFRKDGSNRLLLNLIGDFEFTPLEKGLLETYLWYKDR